MHTLTRVLQIFDNSYDTERGRERVSAVFFLCFVADGGRGKINNDSLPQGFNPQLKCLGKRCRYVGCQRQGGKFEQL